MFRNDIVCEIKSITENMKERMVKSIFEYYKLSGKKKILVVEIGSDLIKGDSFGPFVGELLEESDDFDESIIFPFEVMGTFRNPVNGITLPSKIELLKTKYKDYFVLAIDAVTGGENNTYKTSIGDLVFSPRGVTPTSKSSGNCKSKIGDISIKLDTQDYNKRRDEKKFRVGDFFPELQE